MPRLACFLLSVFISVTILEVSAQGEQKEKHVNYASPSEYKIGGITVSGTQYLDPDILISLSGLSVGDEIVIPGETLSLSIKNLWQQNLFTDIKIYISKIIGSTVFLEIALQEKARLSRFALMGVKKSEAEDIREKIRLIKGRVVNENTNINTVKTIKDYYKEKGFLNVKVTIREVPDTILTNSVLLEIDIDKGKKVKIEKITFHGNVQMTSKKLGKAMKETNEKAKFPLKEILQRDNLKKEFAGRNFFEILGNLSPSRMYGYVSDKTNLNIFKGSKFIKQEYKNDKENIIKSYNSKGYRDAVITKDSVYFSGNNLRIDIFLDEGNRYYFRNISWSGNTKYSDAQLNAILNVKIGEVYNQEILDERLYMSPNGTDVSSLYMDDGYLFFNITPVEVAVENDSIDLEIRIYEGPQATINEVRVYGNTKTKEHVIRRELRTLPGNKFSRSDLIRSQREIVNLGYFNPEQMDVIPVPNPEKGTVDIEYHVVEKPSDQLELSAGWGGRGNGIIGTLGVSFTNFSIQNMFKKGTWTPLPSGDGQRLSLRVQTNGKIFQSYNLSFTEPWLGGKKPNSLTVSFFNSRLADLNVERKVQGSQTTYGATIGIGTRLKWPDDFFIFQTFINYQRYDLKNWRSNFIFSDGRSNNFNVQFILGRNSIDQPIFPTRGSNLSLTLMLTPPYSLLSKRDFSDPEMTDDEKYRWVEYHKWRFNAEWFVPLMKSKNPLVFRLSAKFGWLGLYNRDIGYSPFERFELGGDGLSNITFYGRDIIALRGYDVFTPPAGSPFFNKFTLELRYPFSLNPSATIFALAFVEGGNAWQDIKDYQPFDIRRSAGLGVRIFLPMFGLLGFDYGIGFDKNLGGASSFGNYLSKYGKFSIILGFEPE